MKGNVIVLEGADSSGKTTLAKLLKPAVYIHCLPFVGWVKEAHDAALISAVRHASNGELVIIDRHWISEMIYGPIFRGTTAYGDDDCDRFDRVIQSHGCYVLCVPSSVEEHEARFQRERPEKNDLFDTMTEVAKVYRQLAHGAKDDSIDERHGSVARYATSGGMAARKGTYIYDLDKDGANAQGFVDVLKSRLT